MLDSDVHFGHYALVTGDDGRRKTRPPLDLKYAPNYYIAYVFVPVGLPVSYAINLLVHRHGAWHRLLGAVILILVAVEIALFIRWLQRPIDAEALRRRERERERLHPPKTQFPPSKW